eukprot:5692870-Amphidinium_carterae.1
MKCSEPSGVKIVSHSCKTGPCQAFFVESILGTVLLRPDTLLSHVWLSGLDLEQAQAQSIVRVVSRVRVKRFAFATISMMG